MGEFEGKAALVTGAGSGIGQAVAEELARRGARVAALDVRTDAAQETAAGLPGGTERHLALTADVTSVDEVDRAVNAAVDALGGVDMLANVAGIPDDAALCHLMSPDQWQRVLSVDLTGPFLAARAVLPSMLERGAGAIVNVSSLAGLVASAGGVAYTAAKHGVLGLTKRLAVEYGPLGIRANAVCPGYIATPMNLPYREMVKEAVEATPAGRWAEPEEVARLVAYLLGPDAGYVLGAAFSIDGGATAL
ncbi:SDR family NAD(P)-dependent oxidoreductase [Streptomyces sp. NPDC046909]|uniref:SDR family NAD(P)-dependent oxidoreductase n=1 Tax=Streptomyces sp. NPDC046909 TaxID=3155617 RepID=UPI003405B1B4